ncbi:hypothetical protein F4X86_01675 [Candidatus Saccharibacteria bacterium]|nr:hypothetical protein [Gammaproteobacteria bacterium]MYB39990.1 hypothetical protein [Candidatus Saccharibacteria bacterium]
MNTRLSQLLQDWALRDWGTRDEDFLDHAAIQYLGRIAFDDYEPAQFERFDERLDRWLHNLDNEDDQQTLFLLLNYLFFIGRPEFDSLYRAAYNGNFLRWLIDQLDVDLIDPQSLRALEKGAATTWFCPISDSMRINSFLKANGLAGHSHRPDWRSLRKFADPDKVLRYVEDNHIQRITLLEDFVGSGTQIHSAITFAASISNDIPFLVVPLVVCPDGDKVGLDFAQRHANISYEAVLKISPDALIKPDASANEPQLFQAVRDLIPRVQEKLRNPAPDRESQRYHGYKGTGAVVALYSNCPNNSLPIIHDETAHWQPLFPRIGRP